MSSFSSAVSVVPFAPPPPHETPTAVDEPGQLVSTFAVDGRSPSSIVRAARRRWTLLRIVRKSFQLKTITVAKYVWCSGKETVLLATASCAVLVPLSFIARWLGASLESKSVAAGETTQTLNPLFWADDVEYSRSAFVAFSACQGVLACAAFVPTGYLILHLLYGRKPARLALVVAVPLAILHGCVTFMRDSSRATDDANAWVWLLLIYIVNLCGWPLMGFLVGKETGERALGRKFLVVCICGAALLYGYVNVLAPAYFSGSYVTRMAIRVIVHPIVRITALHLVGSKIALSLKKANPKALHLLPGFIQTGLTTAGRFLQASNSDLLLTVAMEVGQVLCEFAEARDILEGRTTVEWLLHKVFGGKNVATIDARSGDQVGDDRMHPRREQMFGDILTVLAMSEGASSISCVAFLLVVPTNPGVAGGPPLGWRTVAANGLVMLFFELLVSDYLIARVAHRKHATHPERCLSVATVYANRSSSSYVVVYWMYIFMAAYIGASIFSTMCVSGSSGQRDVALLSLCATA